MSRSITIKIRGSGDETDAPSVEDLTEQLRDYCDLLGSVEQALAPDGQTAIVWRVVRAVTASPITFTVEAMARQFAVSVDERAMRVIGSTYEGVVQLQTASARPTYFTDRALQLAERVFERVTNGLDKTEIDFGVPGLPAVNITPTVAREAVRNVRTILHPVSKPYRELGAVEGYFQNVGQDGYGRRLLNLRSRLTGEDVKCFVSGEAEKQLAHCEIGDVWRRRRIEVVGLLHFKGPGRLSHVEAHRLRFFKSEDELPDIDDIIDPDFTGGLSSEEFLARLRDGRLS